MAMMREKKTVIKSIFKQVFILCLLMSFIQISPSVATSEIEEKVNQFFPQTASEFIDALKPRDERPLTRGIALEFEKEEPKVEPREIPKAALQIRFKFNSHQLDDQSKYLLYELSKALESKELSEYRFVIHGHTDSVGSPRYNQKLSLKRASTVEKYLISTLDINSSRLSSNGFGESKLLDPFNPKSSVNRRVEIKNVGR